MLGLGPLDIIRTLGLFILGPKRFAMLRGEIRKLAGELVSADDDDATLPIEIRAMVDGTGRPLRSWHSVPTEVPPARLVDDAEERPDIDPTAPEPTEG